MGGLEKYYLDSLQEDEEYGDDYQEYLYRRMKLNEAVFGRPPQYYSQVTADWHAEYPNGSSTRNLFKVKFWKKVKRILLPPEKDDHDEKTSPSVPVPVKEVITEDEVELNPVGRDNGTPIQHTGGGPRVVDDKDGFFLSPHRVRTAQTQIQASSAEAPRTGILGSLKISAASTSLVNDCASSGDTLLNTSLLEKSSELESCTGITESLEFAAAGCVNQVVATVEVVYDLTLTSSLSTNDVSAFEAPPITEDPPIAQTPSIAEDPPIAENPQIAENPPIAEDQTSTNAGQLIASFLTNENLELMLQPKCQATIKEQLENGSVSEVLFRQIFSDTFTNEIFGQVTTQGQDAADAEKIAENVKGQEPLDTPQPQGQIKPNVVKKSLSQQSLEKRRRNTEKKKKPELSPPSPRKVPKVSEDRIRRQILESASSAMFGGSGDVNHFNLGGKKRSKVKPLLHHTPPGLKPIVTAPLSGRKTPESKLEKPPHGLLTNQDWLPELLSGTAFGVSPGSSVAPSPRNSSSTLGPRFSDFSLSAIPPSLQVYYNYDGRKFFSDRERMHPTGKVKSKPKEVKSEAGTPRTKKGTPTVSRNASSTSVKGTNEKQK